MDMNSDHILLLNPQDEKPHINKYGNMTVTQQHGNDSVTTNTMSIALVFREVNEYYNYGIYTNATIPTTDIDCDKNLEIYCI